MTLAWPNDAHAWDQEVARFLRANPDWLAAHPDLYRSLTPPARVHGEPMADHMAAMLSCERRRSAAMTEQTAAVLAAGRASATVGGRIHDSVIALIGAENPEDCLLQEVPRILSVDAVGVLRHSDPGPAAMLLQTLEHAVGQDGVAFRANPPQARLIYREAAPLARHDALIRLPQIGILGLGSRDDLEAAFRHARAHLRFLGLALARMLAVRRTQRSRAAE